MLKYLCDYCKKGRRCVNVQRSFSKRKSKKKMNVLKVKTNKKDEVVDITDDINKVIRKSGKENGVCILNLLHTTCAITTADLDPGTDEDLLEALRKMLPKISYRHPHDPRHTPDHILSSIIGTSISLVFNNKSLILGTWQRIVLVELNGPKTRKIAYSIR